MSVSISVTAYAGKKSKEFQKHFKAVKFCVENDLSYPKETSDFFKGKIEDCDLEDFDGDILKYIKDGIEVPLKTYSDEWGCEIRIKVSEIPVEAEEIVVRLS